MYQLRAPAPNLQRFIEHYWFVTPDGDAPVDLRVEVFVDGRADLVFNFGVPYQRQVIGGGSDEHQHSNLDAQRVFPIRISQRGLVRISGVRFRLGGLGAFSRGPLRPWTNLTPRPAEVLHHDVLELEKSLAEDPNVDGHAERLDAFFTAQLSIVPSFEAFERALLALGTTDGAKSIVELAETAGVSARQLDRLFGRHLGIAPKTVARIVRFQSVLRRLMKDPGCALADVAADAGYFDQAHFIKDFKQMSGGVPRGYRGYYPPAAPRDFAPNVVVFLQDDGAPRA